MPSISVITPWMNHPDLLPDYGAATQGAECIIVDNGSDEETRQALLTLPAERGKVLRNNSNVGFAAANNQGYAEASGDIIIFLNSDIAADPAWLKLVADDVRDGALYGPSLAQQLVYGRWLPYIEGWCIAATRETWENLVLWSDEDGPWDSSSYPGPYWEDNDLCFRALQAGLTLIQTQWPVQHKGGRTAGPLINHADSIERNRATFTRRVQAGLGVMGVTTTPTYARYMQHCATQSDIQWHLPLLYSLARGNVVELGTRSGVSTAALLAGVEKHGGRLWSIDVEDCSQIAAEHPLWSFIQADSRDLNTIVRAIGERVMIVEGVQTLLVDTTHAYEVTSKELELWSSYMAPGSHILLHDPETFPGVRRAAQEFADSKGWPITFVLPCNGMAVIEVPITKDAPEGVGVSIEGAAWAMEVVG